MKTIIIMSILTAFTLNTVGQNTDLIDISHIQLGKNDDFVYLSFDVTVGRNSAKEYKLITPTIKGESESKDFASIGIESRRAQLISMRNANKNIYTYTYNNGESFIYADSIMYEDWMNGGKLVLNFVDNICCQIANAYSEVKINKIDLPENTKTASPKSVTPTWNTVANNNVIYFAQGKADLEYRFLDNSKFLDEISDILSGIMSGAENQLISIEITGNASPEGIYLSNIQLSCERAIAVKNRLMENIPELNDSMFALNCKGEDWDGLLSMILASDMQYKDEVLDIIKNTTMDDGGTTRKNALKKLKNGIPYKFMMDYLYPELRNVKNVTITFTSIKN